MLILFARLVTICHDFELHFWRTLGSAKATCFLKWLLSHSGDGWNSYLLGKEEGLVFEVTGWGS